MMGKFDHEVDDLKVLLGKVCATLQSVQRCEQFVEDIAKYAINLKGKVDIISDEFANLQRNNGEVAAEVCDMSEDVVKFIDFLDKARKTFNLHGLDPPPAPRGRRTVKIIR